MVSAKGKEKATDSDGKGKRKWTADDDKTGRKRKYPGVAQYIDISAYRDDKGEDSSEDSSEGFSDDSGYDSETFEDVSGSKFKVNNDPGKASYHSEVKEEVMSEEEYDRIMEERYKPGSSFVTYAEDRYDKQNTVESIYVPSAKDPTIWKVKCMVGRERYSAVCLMEKFADMTQLQNKLQIVSACALDHVKGFIIVEADKQQDIYEACKGLSTIYLSKVTAVPINEISRLLSVRSKSSAITKDMWARVKSGRYKGDLAKVVAVNDERKKVTVQLIPRIDLKSLAEKFGGGIPSKRTAVPAQRLITPSELEEFRPLINIRRDRDANMTFEILDGMMLKDGYLYKKIAMDSLSFWGIVPTEDELLKFEPAKKDESTDVQWLTQLFGEKKKKEVKRIKPDKGKGGGKAEGSSSANTENDFELHDLVFFGRKDFGVVIETQKDDTVKVIKEGSEGPLVVNVKQSELKIASFDRKLFTVLDQHSNTLTVNDEVRVLDGPLKGREGIIKKIYKGVLFLYDESEQENNGYICIKAQVCEKVNLSVDDPNEKEEGEPVPSGFADLMSSPKSPLSPDKSLQEKDNKSNFARDDNGMFSVGQSLRIRVGPLKGYICRVLAVRRSDVTVKLDSKHKIITVKSEHLSEVRERNPAIAKGEDSGSVKPFDFLSGQDGSRDWMDAAPLSTEDNKWNAGGSTERSSWSSVPSSDASMPKESGSSDPADDPKKEESSWQLKETPNQSSSWGAAATNTGTGWGKAVEPQLVSSGGALKDDSWGKAAEKWNSGGDASASKAVWGQTTVSSGKQVGGDLDQPETSAWGSAGGTSNVDAVGWAVPAADKQESQSKGWATVKGGDDVTDNSQNDSWNKPSAVSADGGTSWPKQDNKSSWGKSEGTSSWSKQDGGSSWGKKEDACQEMSWGSPKTFDSGRGSGGRSGRGGGRGGRDNYGRGRSFGQDQSSSWSKEGQFGGSKDVGKSTSWSSNPTGGWGNSVPDEGSKGNDGWGKQNVSEKGEGSAWNQGSNANKDVGGQGWGSTNAEADNKSSGWNVSKDSNSGGSSSWGASSNATEQTGAAGSGDSSWDKLKKPNENNKSSWNAAATSLDGKPNENNWGSQKASTENSGWNQSSAGNGNDGSSGSWNVAKNNDSSSGGWKNNDSSSGGWKKNDSSSGGWKSNEGSSSGWGQSNWSNKNGTSDSGGNQDGTWSSKGNWNSGGGFNDRNNQDDGGRGGGWRGRGGRGDRGGFRGRGGSDSGDFGGRGGRGRYGGGGSDRGGYGGRGGSDREGFQGRGGFRGRGRGDWNNREDNSNQDRSSSWGRGSNNGGEGWKSSGNASSWKQGDGGGSNNGGEGWKSTGNASSWKQGDGGGSNNGGNRGSSWNQPKDNAQTGGWGKTNDSNKDAVQSDAGGSGWESVGAPAKEVSAGWGTPPAKKETSGWKTDGTPTAADTKEKAAGSSWGAPPVNSNSSGGWNKPETTDGAQTGASSKSEGPSDSWSKPATGAWGGSPSTNTNSTKDNEPSDPWGKAATSTWGNGSGSGSGSGSGKGGW